MVSVNRSTDYFRALKTIRRKASYTVCGLTQKHIIMIIYCFMIIAGKTFESYEEGKTNIIFAQNIINFL